MRLKDRTLWKKFHSLDSDFFNCYDQHFYKVLTFDFFEKNFNKWYSEKQTETEFRRESKS